jgi:saccharopine dehydrogenase-like NADP-dependent oxidoreductase
VEEFYSLCGALPSPESTDNPFRYKFSWSPKGVVLAGNNTGRYLHNNQEINTPTENLFKDIYSFEFPKVGKLEVYPNRDSIDYIDIYGIPEAKTVFRGTLRFPGWCESLDAMKACKLTSCEEYDFTGLSYAGFMAKLIGCNSINIKEETAAYLGIAVDSTAITAMEWLGLFSDAPMNRGIDSPYEITSDLMIEKMTLGKSERDMVVMQHSFMAAYPDGSKEVILSRMLDFGFPGGDTSVARTVALPAAIGVEMILQNKITEKGVYRPVLPGIYNPILDRLEEMNIRMEEQYMLPESAMIRK